jgi:hypothetical protein
MLWLSIERSRQPDSHVSRYRRATVDNFSDVLTRYAERFSSGGDTDTERHQIQIAEDFSGLSRVVHRQTLLLSDTGAFVWPACAAAFSMVKISRSRGSCLSCSLRPSPSSNNRCKPRCRKFYGRPHATGACQRRALPA